MPKAHMKADWVTLFIAQSFSYFSAFWVGISWLQPPSNFFVGRFLVQINLFSDHSDPAPSMFGPHNSELLQYLFQDNLYILSYW